MISTRSSHNAWVDYERRAIMKNQFLNSSIAIILATTFGQVGAATSRGLVGSPVQERLAGSRIVDVTTARSVNVNCGEIVTFRNEGRTFSWKFDVANHGAINLRDIAPAGFAQKPIYIYVSGTENERTSGA